MNDAVKTYTAAPDLLKDRVIMVTGAGAGIGRSAALSCAAHGATVILLGRTTKKLEEVYDEIETAGGARPGIAVLDLLKAQGEAYTQLATTIDQEYGKLDGLLHNAGILGQRSPIEHHEVKSWLQVMHVNVNSAFILTQAMLPLLKAAPEASIVFTSSGVGRVGRAYWGAYAVSKFATEGLAQVLADEMRDSTNIRVNCINPGATRTNMRSSAYPAEDPEQLKHPDAIMGPYLYLLGPDSKDVNGQSLDCQ
ncbi:MAG: YciK family oxidoreductase [Gammaproteobacteria bacterium]